MHFLEIVVGIVIVPGNYHSWVVQNLDSRRHSRSASGEGSRDVSGDFPL